MFLVLDAAINGSSITKTELALDKNEDMKESMVSTRKQTKKGHKTKHWMEHDKQGKMKQSTMKGH